MRIKIEQVLKYRKASFPKSVSTTFVTHCGFEFKAHGAQLAQFWCAINMEDLWGILQTQSSSIPNARNGGDNQQLISSNLVARAEANLRCADN